MADDRVDMDELDITDELIAERSRTGRARHLRT